EEGAVRPMQSEPRRVPAVAADDRVTKQLDVVVVACEQELVERLLERPEGRRDGAADGSPDGAGANDGRDQGPATVTGEARTGTPSAMDHEVLHRRARERGVNPVVYWIVRAVLQPFFHVYFRMTRIGREHI